MGLEDFAILIARVELSTDKIKFGEDPTRNGSAKTKQGLWYWKRSKTDNGRLSTIIKNDKLGVTIISDYIEIYPKLIGNSFKSHIIIRAYNNL